MKRPNGPYVVLSASFHRDADILEVGERAAWLYLAMTLECRTLRSDGWITARQVAGLGVPQWKTRLQVLLDAGLVEEARGAAGRYWIPAYLKWNKSEQDYRDRAARGRHFACQRWHDQPCADPDCSDGTPNGLPIGTPNGGS